MDKRKLIIDCDTGTDDAVAIMALLLCERFEVLGITAVHGNQPVENTADNNLRLLDWLGFDVPVYQGCACALVRGLSRGRELNTRMARLNSSAGISSSWLGAAVTTEAEKTH